MLLFLRRHTGFSRTLIFKSTPALSIHVKYDNLLLSFKIQPQSNCRRIFGVLLESSQKILRKSKEDQIKALSVNIKRSARKFSSKTSNNIFNNYKDFVVIKFEVE